MAAEWRFLARGHLTNPNHLSMRRMRSAHRHSLQKASLLGLSIPLELITAVPAARGLPSGRQTAQD